jgi:hypothetical protein
MPFSEVLGITWGQGMDNLYSFVYKGILTDESLDQIGSNHPYANETGCVDV